ncbi:MAG: hypothetical protein ACJ8AD_18885 [Gemmatimonadaceae bacterium]
MTLLVLADATDGTAARLTLLARRLGRAVRFVVPADLASGWTHRIDGRDVRTRLTLRDGAMIDDAALAGVFNRAWAIPASAAAPFDGADRDYAIAELHALVVSWLASLRCPVMNRAAPNALAGGAYSAARWQLLAHAAGFDTTALRYTTSQRRFPAPGMVRVDRAFAAHGTSRALELSGPATFGEPAGVRNASLLVVGETVWPEQMAREEAAPLVEPCRRIARAAGVTLLRVHVADGGAPAQPWQFVGADPMPTIDDEGPLRTILGALGGPGTAA